MKVKNHLAQLFGIFGALATILLAAFEQKVKQQRLSGHPRWTVTDINLQFPNCGTSTGSWKLGSNSSRLPIP